jgi:hypothetical protein
MWTNNKVCHKLRPADSGMLFSQIMFATKAPPTAYYR